LEGNESSEEDYIFPTLPEKPVSVIAFNGLADKHVPYYGGLQEKYAGARPVYITSAQQMHAFWIKANQCLPKAQIFRDPLNQYKKITYRGKENTEIVQYIIFDHGHSWPGGRVLRLGRGDVPCKAVNATDVMWEFFKSHPKR
jgi:polyhydroxybutyrate depolymerase